MRADVRGPTTRFRRRRRRGRQGNRRQPLSSAVAGGTTGRREGRPLPHSPAEVGGSTSPPRAGAARWPPPHLSTVSGRSDGVERRVAPRGSRAWPGRYKTATALPSRAIARAQSPCRRHSLLFPGLCPLTDHQGRSWHLLSPRAGESSPQSLPDFPGSPSPLIGAFGQGTHNQADSCNPAPGPTTPPRSPSANVFEAPGEKGRLWPTAGTSAGNGMFQPEAG